MKIARRACVQPLSTEPSLGEGSSEQTMEQSSEQSGASSEQSSEGSWLGSEESSEETSEERRGFASILATNTPELGVCVYGSLHLRLGQFRKTFVFRPDCNLTMP